LHNEEIMALRGVRAPVLGRGLLKAKICHIFQTYIIKRLYRKE